MLDMDNLGEVNNPDGLPGLYDTTATARSVQPPPVSFESVDLEEWKRWIAMSLYSGARMGPLGLRRAARWYTDGRPARRRSKCARVTAPVGARDSVCKRAHRYQVQSQCARVTAPSCESVLTAVGGGYKTWEATALKSARDEMLPGVLT
eukprot:5869998-Pleurochrysis_carterae.AAC.1